MCETELEPKGKILARKHTTDPYYCPGCKIEYQHSRSEKGDRWYAHIALGDFPKPAWEKFLFTEWNYYGQVMPERLGGGNYVSEEEKREASEWYAKHPREDK